jgi:hypothetical protein
MSTGGSKDKNKNASLIVEDEVVDELIDLYDKYMDLSRTDEGKKEIRKQIIDMYSKSAESYRNILKENILKHRINIITNLPYTSFTSDQKKQLTQLHNDLLQSLTKKDRKFKFSEDVKTHDGGRRLGVGRKFTTLGNAKANLEALKREQEAEEEVKTQHIKRELKLSQQDLDDAAEFLETPEGLNFKGSGGGSLAKTTSFSSSYDGVLLAEYERMVHLTYNKKLGLIDITVHFNNENPKTKKELKLNTIYKYVGKSGNIVDLPAESLYVSTKDKTLPPLGEDFVLACAKAYRKIKSESSQKMLDSSVNLPPPLVPTKYEPAPPAAKNKTKTANIELSFSGDEPAPAPNPTTTGQAASLELSVSDDEPAPTASVRKAKPNNGAAPDAQPSPGKAKGKTSSKARPPGVAPGKAVTVPSSAPGKAAAQGTTPASSSTVPTASMTISATGTPLTSGSPPGSTAPPASGTPLGSNTADDFDTPYFKAKFDFDSESKTFKVTHTSSPPGLNQNIINANLQILHDLNNDLINHHAMQLNITSNPDFKKHLKEKFDAEWSNIYESFKNGVNAGKAYPNDCLMQYYSAWYSQKVSEYNANINMDYVFSGQNAGGLNGLNEVLANNINQAGNVVGLSFNAPSGQDAALGVNVPTGVSVSVEPAPAVTPGMNLRARQKIASNADKVKFAQLYSQVKENNSNYSFMSQNAFKNFENLSDDERSSIHDQNKFFEEIGRKIFAIHKKKHHNLDLPTASVENDAAYNVKKIDDFIDFAYRGVKQELELIDKATTEAAKQGIGPDIEPIQKMYAEQDVLKERLKALEEIRKMTEGMHSLAKNRALYDSKHFDDKTKQIQDKLAEIGIEENVRELIDEYLKQSLRDLEYEQKFKQGLHHQIGKYLLPETLSSRISPPTRFSSTDDVFDPTEGKKGFGKVWHHGEGESKQVFVKSGIRSHKDLYGISHLANLSTARNLTRSKASDLSELQKDMQRSASTLICEYDKGSEQNPVHITYCWADGSSSKLGGDPPKQPVEALQMLTEFKRRAMLEGKNFYATDDNGKLVTIAPDQSLNEGEKALFNRYAKEHGTAYREKYGFMYKTKEVKSNKSAGEILYGTKRPDGDYSQDIIDKLKVECGKDKKVRDKNDDNLVDSLSKDQKRQPGGLGIGRA